jgi:predicted metal-binding membrane protein
MVMAVAEARIDGLAAGGRLGARGMRARRLGLWLTILGWVAMSAMWVTGSAALFGHDQEGIPAFIAVFLFMVGWTVMVAGMMIPSSLPTLALVDRASDDGHSASRLMVGYFSAWAAFGAVAFAGDTILHLSVSTLPWLAERPSLILGTVAMFAGVAEMIGRASPPRYPAVPPAAGSFSLGRAHAFDRIRRCWPLMLFSMAVGMATPLWMAGLTLLMLLELHPRAEMVLRVAGLVLVTLGAAVVMEPRWVHLFPGAG